MKVRFVIILSLLFMTGSGLSANCPDYSDKHFKAEFPPENAIWLDTLDTRWFEQSYHSARSALSVDGNPISIAGEKFLHGVGTHAHSSVTVQLYGQAECFAAMVGIDDETCHLGDAIFQVWVDGQKKIETGLIKHGQKPEKISVDLTGARELKLVTAIGERATCDHADWAGAFIKLKQNAVRKPEILPPIPLEETYPIASGISPYPQINGPRIIGTTPGKPFLFLIPASGQGALTFSAKHLPRGLSLNKKTGIISGHVKKEGTTKVRLTVNGKKGTFSRCLTIVAGNDKLALTPPMGWNSWNIYGLAVSDEVIRQTADQMIRTGLAAHGYAYINIDDGWEDKRDKKGYIHPNEKFPDMQALSKYVHQKGLKLGIYSSPGPETCGGFLGSYKHEQQDVETYVKWGIDYLKYDWCSYYKVTNDQSRAGYQAPYILMNNILDNCNRDIIYSICQYGMDNVWEWGEEVGGHLWRTTDDIVDTWESLSTIGFRQHEFAPYAGPGHWNDPDMLIVGYVGWGGGQPYQTRLYPNEQITHMTLWSLHAAPLLIGCDLSLLDQFTIDLLTNRDVIDVNQDPLGKQAKRIHQDGDLEIWARPLFDGTQAVGLFNRGITRAAITIQWADLNLSGSQPVRDLWQKKDLGTFPKSFTAEVPIHGAVFIKIGKPQPNKFE